MNGLKYLFISNNPRISGTLPEYSQLNYQTDIEVFLAHNLIYMDQYHIIFIYKYELYDIIWKQIIM